MDIVSACWHCHKDIGRGHSPPPSSLYHRNASPYGQEDTIIYMLYSMASIVRIVMVLP